MPGAEVIKKIHWAAGMLIDCNIIALLFGPKFKMGCQTFGSVQLVGQHSVFDGLCCSLGDLCSQKWRLRNQS